MEAEQKINQVDDSDDLWMARVEHVPTRSLLGAVLGRKLVCARGCVCAVYRHGGGRRRRKKNGGERGRGWCAELGSGLSKLVLFWKHRFCTGSLD